VPGVDREAGQGGSAVGAVSAVMHQAVAAVIGAFDAARVLETGPSRWMVSVRVS